MPLSNTPSHNPLKQRAGKRGTVCPSLTLRVVTEPLPAANPLNQQPRFEAKRPEGERPSSRSIRPVIWILGSVFLGYLSESLLWGGEFRTTAGVDCVK
jgi:hypothetical protein